jgi:hypothetical protein
MLQARLNQQPKTLAVRYLLLFQIYRPWSGCSGA